MSNMLALIPKLREVSRGQPKNDTTLKWVVYMVGSRAGEDIDTYAGNNFTVKELALMSREEVLRRIVRWHPYEQHLELARKCIEDAA